MNMDFSHKLKDGALLGDMRADTQEKQVTQFDVVKKGAGERIKESADAIRRLGKMLLQ